MMCTGGIGWIRTNDTISSCQLSYYPKCGFQWGLRPLKTCGGYRFSPTPLDWCY